MDLKEQLLSLFNSKAIPDYSSLVNLADRCLNLLEKEDVSYRPVEKSVDGFSGGLLSFLNNDSQKPVLVVPDIHARKYLFIHLIFQKIFIESLNCEMTVLEALEKKLVYVVCVGDIFHSELRSYTRWKQALVEFKGGNVFSEEMKQEMEENLNLLQMIFLVKLSFPENFHILKGNHENILNEEGKGNHPFYKMAAEGEMFYSFMSQQYDDALIYILSLFEHALPVCAVFPNLVVSHAEPAFAVTKTKLINYKKHPEVVLALTWTGNDQAEAGSVSKSIKNLIGRNSKNVIWIGGHRPVEGKYALRQKGKFVQIHNPDEENIAVVLPEKEFNPEEDIYPLSDNLIYISM